MRQGRAQDEAGVADTDRVAELQPKAIEQRRRDDRAPDAVALRQRRSERLRRIERDDAVKRIGAIGCFQLDEAARSTAVRDRHGAQPRDARERALRGEESAFGRAGRALRQAELDIATEQRAGIAIEARIDRRAERADTGDDGDTETKTAEQNTEALEPAAQLALGQAPGETELAHAALVMGGPPQTGRGNLAIAQMNNAVTTLGQCRVMGDQQQSRAALGMQREQQIDHLLAGLAIEIAGRLVGQQQRRLRRESAGDGDALLLAARKLRGVMLHRSLSPTAASPAAAAAKASPRPASSSGTATFSSAVIVGTR